MSKLLKVLLIWLCALSFPLQGMAAVVMLSCVGSHHQAVQEGHHQLEAEHAEHHHDMAASHQDSGEHKPHHASGHSADKCSACASCCIGVGMAATLPQWQGESPGPSALVASTGMLLPSFMAEGLERPPRSSLALT